MELKELGSYFGLEYIEADFVGCADLIDRTALGLLSDVRKQKYDLKNTQQTYRTINYWSNIGLLDDYRENNRCWRKFSIVELAFIFIISSLRDFGVSLETIKEVKKELFRVPTTPYYTNPNKINLIEYAVIHSAGIPDHGNTYLILTQNKEIYLTSILGIEGRSILEKLPATNLLMNLNKTFHLMLPKYFKEQNAPCFKVDAKYLDIIRATSNPSSEKIIINKKGVDIDSIESVYSTDKSKIHELIESVGYGEMNLKIKNGKVVHIKSTKKEKF